MLITLFSLEILRLYSCTCPPTYLNKSTTAHTTLNPPKSDIYIFCQPGDAKSVTLVSIGGHKVIRGGNSIADGPIDNSRLDEVMEKVNTNSFGHEDYPDSRLFLSIY